VGVCQQTEKTFELGEVRIFLVLFLLMLAPSGSRPASILALQFRHIEILLVRNPEDPTGNPVIVLQFALEFTKTYIGEKVVQVPCPLHCLLARVSRVERRMEVVEDCIERVKPEVMEEVEARVEETAAELRDEWSCSIDDMVTGVKIDLEDYVRHELQDAQECIVNNLQAGS
jgi:hypothetical protein